MDPFVLNPLHEAGRPLLTHLACLFFLGLLMSAGGFYRVVYFVSIGYAFSIAGMSLATGILYASSLSLLALLQLLLLLAYGLRLGTFLVARERSDSYQREREEIQQRSHRVPVGVRFAIWLSVALLYVAMFSPALFNLALLQAKPQPVLPSLAVGIPLMALGLCLEGLADKQKSSYKALAPSRFCDQGLFRYVRCPNYLGEILFWIGQFLSGISGYQHYSHWLLALAGLICIILIMLGAARNLEIKQDGRYGKDEEYQRYVRTVPILFPWIPIYSLRNLKVYLG